LVAEGDLIKLGGVAHNARVIGTMQLKSNAQLTRPITIRLGRRTVVDLPAGGSAGLLQNERVLTMNAPGFFSMERLTPGLKAVNIAWETSGGHRYSDYRVIEVQPNHVFDLGIVDGSGGAIKVTAAGMTKDLRVHVAELGGVRKGSNETRFRDLAKLRKDEAVTFHGLPPGEYSITLKQDGEDLRETRTVAKETVSVKFDLPEPHTTSVRVICEGAYDRAEISIPTGNSGAMINDHFDLQREGTQSTGAATIELPRRARIATVTATKALNSIGDTAVGVLMLSPTEAQHSIRLTESTTVTGKASVASRTYVFAGVVGYEDILWVTATDEGAFQFVDLPRKTQLWMRLKGGDNTVVTTSSTNEPVEVTLGQ